MNFSALTLSSLRKVFWLFFPKWTHLAAFLLGAIALASYPPASIPPLIIVSIAGLFYLWYKSPSAFDSAKLGLYFGWGLFGFGLSWLYKSMHSYSDVYAPIAFLLAFGWVTYHTLFVVAAGYLAGKLKGNPAPISLLVIFPIVWVVFELLRSSVLGGYPLLLSGASQLHTWLDGYIPVFGVWGASFALALTAGSVVLIYIRRKWLVSVLLICSIWFGGLALTKVEWVQPTGGQVKVALIQTNVPQHVKWLPNNLVPIIKNHINLSKLFKDSDVIVWPETAIPANLDQVEYSALKPLIEEVGLVDKDIVTGVLIRDLENEKYYNSIVNLSDTSQHYYKKHLVPFSEYFPFEDYAKPLAKLFDIPFSYLNVGESHQQLLEVGGHKIGMGICFEMSFGEELALQLPEARYFITVSNDAWFDHTLEPYQQLHDVQVRALELGREMARSTSTGFTAVIDVKGNIREQVPAYEVAVLSSYVQPYEGLTPYARWKWWPILLLMSLISFAVLISSLLGRRSV